MQHLVARQLKGQGLRSPCQVGWPPRTPLPSAPTPGEVWCGIRLEEGFLLLFFLFLIGVELMSCKTDPFKSE